MGGCSGSRYDPIFRAVAAPLRRLRIRLAAWSGSRTRRRRNLAFDFCFGPDLPCDLGQSHGLQASERGTSRDRCMRHGIIYVCCFEGQSPLDDTNGIGAGPCGAISFPEIHKPGYEPLRLCRVFEGSLVFADSVAIPRNRTLSPTSESYWQISLLVDLLAPAIGPLATAYANLLLDEFGSISGVAAAPPEAIKRALGGDIKLATMLAAGREIVHLGMREVVRSQEVDSNDPALHKYLLAQFSGLQEEHMLVLFLDESHRLISKERYTSGSTGFLSLRPRKLFSRALALGCHAIVLAHNHPSGDPNPSQSDVDATRRVAADARFLDIKLLDHLVIGRSKVTSMLRGGLI